MAERQAAEGEVGEQRLDVAQQRRALGRVADVADRGVAGQGGDHRLAAEVVADQAERAVTVEQAAVEGDHAGRLLAAVLQRVQAEHGVRGGLVVAEDAEHAALLAQLVAHVAGSGRAARRGGGRRRVRVIRRSAPWPSALQVAQGLAVRGQLRRRPGSARRGAGTKRRRSPAPSST